MKNIMFVLLILLPFILVIIFIKPEPCRNIWITEYRNGNQPVKVQKC